MVVHLPPAPSDAATVGSQTLVESRNPRAPFLGFRRVRSLLLPLHLRRHTNNSLLKT